MNWALKLNYEVQFSDKALKTLKQIDKHQAKLILAWINKNISECCDPRIQGKALVGDKKYYWRYQVGSYRLIAEIDDGQVRINIINIGHQREIYNR